jgi:hypothetical protein
MSGPTAGSIFPRKNPSGVVVYKVEIPNGFLPNGRRKMIRRTAATKSEAKILQRQLLAQIENNRLTPAREENLQDYALWWIRSVKAHQVRYSTASDYEDRFRRWIFPHMGFQKLSSIEPRGIERWMAKLKAQNYATTTINGARRALNGVLQHAYKTGIIPRNPVAAVSPYKSNRDEKTSVREPWSKAEVLTALQIVQNSLIFFCLHIPIIDKGKI